MKIQQEDIPLNHKRRRIKSPKIEEPNQNNKFLSNLNQREEQIINQSSDPPLRRRRRRISSHNDTPPYKKLRTDHSNYSQTSKRTFSPDRPHLFYHDQTQLKRQKLNLVQPISNRSKINSNPFPKLRPSHLKSTTTSSSSNFIPNPEIRTQYARDVARAEKKREEGNKFYNKKQYQLAIKSYIEATESYPLQPLPNQPHHPGYSTCLANLGSAFMALSEYQLAVEKLHKSIESVEIPLLIPQETRIILIKRLFRLVRCHLALLDSQAASSTLYLVQNPQSPIHITPNDSSFIHEFSTLLTRSSFLLQAESEVSQARSDLQWENVLQVVKSTQSEVLDWGLNLKPNFLPGLWPIWKAEALARLGSPLEAEQAVFHLNHTCPFPSELKMVQVLIYLASGKLEEADAKLTTILNEDLDDTNARLLAVYLKGLMTQLTKIEETCTQLAHLEVINQCEGFLLALIDPITLTLRILVYTIMCEQLSEYCIRNPDLQCYLPWKIIELSDMVLTKYIGFSSENSTKQPMSTYPIYRSFVIKILIARARATLEAIPQVSKSTYALIFELMNETWPDLDIENRTRIFAEIQARIGISSRTYDSNFYDSEPDSHSSYPHLPPSFPSWDPKGYYQILEVSKGATASEIKKSFRRLSLKHHPDKGGKTELFQALNFAYEVLSDQNSRNSYDLFGL